MSVTENKQDNSCCQQLSQTQLVRVLKDIKRLSSQDNRFCFLVGAGASISSGIPSGYDLSNKWYDELKDDDILNDTEINEWEKRTRVTFNKENRGAFYPFLYEKRYSASPQTGYEEFQRLMEDKEPSIGYVILSQILTKEKHNFVITTNFDYLIEDAIRMYTSKKPFIAGHETLAEFISSQTERPTIIKVHRDLFLHPFNDSADTGTLKEEWKNALSPILKNFSLLVIGYGGNDGSLMDYLSSINPKDRKPIYWCKRKGDILNKKVNELLTKRDYICNIDGFDELMHSLYNGLGYNVFAGLDKIDEHDFVASAKKRATSLKNKLADLIDKLTKENKPVTEEIRKIIEGATKYFLDAHTESDNEKKQKIYEEGIKEYPDDAYLAASYATFLFDTGNNTLANTQFENATRVMPDYYLAYNNWGVKLGDYAVTKNGNEADEVYAKAFEKYAKAIEIKPDYYLAYRNWGTDLSRQAVKNSGDVADKLYDSAFAKFTTAAELKPDDPHTYYNWGTYLGKQAATKTNGDADRLYDKAYKMYAKAIELKPDYHQAYYNWGGDLCRQAATKTGEHAEILYTQASEKIKSNIAHGGRYYNLACIYAIKADKENAFHYLDISLLKKETSTKFVLEDPDWERYKTDSAFMAIIEKYKPVSA